MPSKIDKLLVNNFLKKVIQIEEEPTFMRGAQETARRKKIYDALNEICE
jgi:hypothetical protein